MPTRPERSVASPPRDRRRPQRPPARRRARGRPSAVAGRFTGESPITPFVIAYHLLSLVAVVAAWMKGGHPERLAAVVTLVVFAASFHTHALKLGRFYAGDAAVDVLMTGFFVWMALTSDRWWALIMSGIMGLTLLVYVAVLVVPAVGAYAELSARVGLGILAALTLLASVGERWLSGERAVSDQGAWRRGARLKGAALFRPST